MIKPSNVRPALIDIALDFFTRTHTHLHADSHTHSYIPHSLTHTHTYTYTCIHSFIHTTLTLTYTSSHTHSHTLHSHILSNTLTHFEETECQSAFFLFLRNHVSKKLLTRIFKQGHVCCIKTCCFASIVSILNGFLDCGLFPNSFQYYLTLFRHYYFIFVSNCFFKNFRFRSVM